MKLSLVAGRGQVTHVAVYSKYSVKFALFILLSRIATEKFVHALQLRVLVGLGTLCHRHHRASMVRTTEGHIGRMRQIVPFLSHIFSTNASLFFSL